MSESNSGAPIAISSIDLDAYIAKALEDKFVTVAEFQEAIQAAQADGNMTKAEVAKLTTLKAKAEADNPDADSKATITTAYVSAIPIEMLPALLRQEALKWGAALILILAGTFMTWVLSILERVVP